VLAYAFHILAARTLTQSEYGQVAAFWAALFIAVVVLFRPLEQTTSRSLADRLERGLEGWSVLRAVALVYVCLVGVVVVAGALSWSVLTRELFDGSGFMTAMLLLGIAGYGVQYVARGILGGLRRFHGLSSIHLGDGVVRLALALPLVYFGSKDIAAAALAAAGIGGAVGPLWRCRSQIGSLKSGRSDERFHISAALSFAAPAGVIAGSDQLLVNGAPLLVIAGGGSTTDAALVFAATMLVRVPVFFFSGVAGSLLPNLARLNAAADHKRFARTVTKVCLTFAAATVAITAGAALLGPVAMRLLYGSEYSGMSAGDLALLGFAAGCYLACGTVSQALLALARAGTGAAAWATAAGVFILVVSVSSRPVALHNVALGLAVAMAVNALLLAIAFARRVRTGAAPG
jgi:O-antigen/teichoic acid export membrane protein